MQTGSATVAAVACFGLLAAACGGPSVGDIGNQQVTLDVLAFNAGPGAVGGDGAGGAGEGGDAAGGAASMNADTADYVITKALVNVSGMKLTPCTSDADAIDIPARVYDLLATPPLGETVTTAVEGFCSLQVDVAPAATATDGIPKGEAFYVKGQNDDSDSFKDSFSLTFAKDDHSSFGDSPLILGFDLTPWRREFTSPLPAAQAPDDVSAALYVDANGNDALDADEQTPIARGVVTLP